MKGTIRGFIAGLSLSLIITGYNQAWSLANACAPQNGPVYLGCPPAKPDSVEFYDPLKYDIEKILQENEQCQANTGKPTA
jgi:hypothetical protein